MGSSLIVHYGNEPAYLGIVWELARLSAAEGHDPVLLDITDVLGGVGDSLNRRVLGLFQVPSADVVFRRIVEDSPFERLDAAGFAQRGAAFRPSEAALEGIRETTHSALVSYSRDPEPDTSRGVWRRLERDLLRGAERTYRAVSQLLAERPEIESVHVLNGRFPHQRAALEAALAAGRHVVHYEKGDRPDTYWRSSHSTLDREATQGSVDDVLAHLSPDEALDLGRTWMERRVSGGTNIYARFFGSGDDDDAGGTGQRVVGLFTSSQDEFAALGPEWHIQAWTDQWDAFEAVLDHLASPDTRFYLRVHPNFATKSHASFRRERARLEQLRSRHPDVQIIWHDEKVNSYSLVNSTDAVVVWDSTIGLEASARGKPVWELAASYFDLYADVRQWFGDEDAPAASEVEYPVDADRALRFMAYLELREPDLSPEALAVRDAVAPRPGAGVRVASVLSSGGAPRARIAVRSIIDSFRHRRAAVNLKAARQYAAR